MPSSMTEITNAILTRKTGSMSRFPMAGARPFVVCSLDTKRNAPRARNPCVKVLPPIPRCPTTKDSPSVHRHGSMKETSQPVSRTIIPSGVKPHRNLLVPAPGKTIKVQTTLAPPRVSSQSAGRSSPRKTFVPRSLPLVQRPKGGKLMSGVPASTKSTHVTVAGDLPPRPGCIPRLRTNQSSVGAPMSTKGKQGKAVKGSTTLNAATARQTSSISIGAAKARESVKVSAASVKKPGPGGPCSTGVSIGNPLFPLPQLVPYTRAYMDSYVDWSPPPSPDLSSFPSQTWTIVVNADATKINTPAAASNDDTLPILDDDSTKLGVAGMPTDSCAPAKSVPSLPAISPPLTAVETPACPAECVVGLAGALKTNSLTEASTEVSSTVGSATIISSSTNGTSSSMAALVKVMDSTLGSSGKIVSDTNGNGARMTIRRAMDVARSFLSPSHRVSEASTETAASKTMGANVSGIRRLFSSQIDKDQKASKNPMTQLEIEMLRARKKVAGGAIVDLRLDRLDSLAAMAIVTKHGMTGLEGLSRA